MANSVPCLRQAGVQKITKLCFAYFPDGLPIYFTFYKYFGAMHLSRQSKSSRAAEYL